MYEVDLFHQSPSRILQNVFPDRQTDSVDQDQTAQTVQSDVGCTLSVNLWDILLSKIISKCRYSGFNHVLESFIQFFAAG